MLVGFVLGFRAEGLRGRSRFRVFGPPVHCFEVSGRGLGVAIAERSKASPEILFRYMGVSENWGCPILGSL